MTDDEKKVHVSKRKENAKNKYPDSDVCQICGKAVVISGSNMDVDNPTESIDPNEADEIICVKCYIKKYRNVGVAG